MPSRAITVIEFNNFAQDLGLGRHIIGTHDIHAQLIDSIPNVSDATNTAYTQVVGGNYTAGGIDLSVTQAAGTPPRWVWSTLVDTLWAEHASGFTDALAVLITNITTGRHIAFADITVDAGVTPVTNVGQPVDVNWANSGELVYIN